MSVRKIVDLSRKTEPVRYTSLAGQPSVRPDSPFVHIPRLHKSCLVKPRFPLSAVVVMLHLMCHATTVHLCSSPFLLDHLIGPLDFGLMHDCPVTALPCHSRSHCSFVPDLSSPYFILLVSPSLLTSFLLPIISSSHPLFLNTISDITTFCPTFICHLHNMPSDVTHEGVVVCT